MKEAHARLSVDAHYEVLRHIPEIVRKALTVRGVSQNVSVDYISWVSSFIDLKGPPRPTNDSLD